MKTKARVTYGEFEEMVKLGVFDDTDDRFELLEGEIVRMTTPGPAHEFEVDELAEWSFQSAPLSRVRVRVQQSLGVAEFESLTLPDIAWMRRRDYSKRRPVPADVLLLIEVAASTLSKDRNRKGRIYARAGIADYWIVNIRGRCVEVRRNPEPSGFRDVEVFRPGDVVRPLAFPKLALPVSRLFPNG